MIIRKSDSHSAAESGSFKRINLPEPLGESTSLSEFADCLTPAANASEFGAILFGEGIS